MRKESLPAEFCGQGYSDHFCRLEGSHLSAPGAFEGEGECQVLLCILKTLQRHVDWKQLELKNHYHLYHNNARLHTARIIMEYLEANNIHVISHPSYSPDFALCDFWLFPTLKKNLHGRRFNLDEDVMQATRTYFSSLPAPEFEKTIKVKNGRRS